jgi:hypothetical protein
LPAVPEEDVEALKTRIEALEHELADRTERAGVAVAAAQERAYWLDRWHVDLNAVMEHRIALRAHEAARALGRVKRAAGYARARILG